jgi:hypothetical protein
MTRAIFMTNEQVEELVALAKQDQILWRQLKDRELEGERREAAARAQGKWQDSPDVVLDPLVRPSRDELIFNFLVKQYGADQHFYRGQLTMALRREVRIELGLPT